MLPADFQKERIKINNRLGPKLNKIHKLANKGNSLSQKLVHSYQRWMDSRDEGDLRVLGDLLDQFEQAERDNKL